MGSALDVAEKGGRLMDAEHIGTQGRRSKLRRRFLLVSVALLSTLLAVLGVGFAADAGTSTVSVTAADGVLVHPVAGGNTAPTAAVTLPKGSASAATSNTWLPQHLPAWSVAAGTAGQVTTPGDLVYIDATVATATKVQISVFVTNLDKLAVNYSSWAFDIAVYQSADPTLASPVWTKVTDSFVTSDRGAHTFTVDVSTAGKHLGIAMDEGTFYTVQIDTETGSLQPSFFIRATEL